MLNERLQKIYLGGFLFFLFGLLLPTQVGKHFFFSFSYINGVRVDYLAPTLYASTLLLLLLVIYKVVTSKKKIYIPHAKYILVFFSYLFINVIISNNGYIWFYRMWQYVQIGLVVFIFYRANSFEKKWFLFGLACTSLFSLILALLQIVNQGSIQGIWWFFGERLFSINSPGVSTVSVQGIKVLRPYATFSHPNSMGGFFLVTYLLLTSPTTLLLGVIPALIVILSFSRTAIIVFSLLIVYRSLKVLKKCTPCFIAKLFFSLWLILFTFLWRGAPFSIIDRIVDWKNFISSTGTVIFGHGLGTYIVSSAYRITPQPIHNIFLLIANEWGFIILGVVLLKTRYLLNYKISAALIAVLITGFFDHYWLTLIQNQLLLGVVIGFILSSVPTSQTQNSEKVVR